MKLYLSPSYFKIWGLNQMRKFPSKKLCGVHLKLLPLVGGGHFRGINCPAHLACSACRLNVLLRTEETLRQGATGGHSRETCLQVTFGIGWRDMSGLPIVFAAPHSSLWAVALSSVKWKGTVSKVPPWISNTMWRICLALEKDTGHSWNGRALPSFCIFSGGRLCVLLWASLIAHVLFPEMPELRRGEEGPRALTECLVVSPLGDEFAPPPPSLGPRKSILQLSHPISDCSSLDWVSRPSRHSGYCLV